jgi:hypothetical protein
MSRGGQRALAVVAVLIMLGAAVLVRGWLDGGGGKDGEPPSTSSGSSSSGRPTLLCAAELGAVCDAIQLEHDDVDVRVEPAATSAARLAAATDPDAVGVDGWLTIAPQSGIVNDAQDRNGRGALFAPDETVARSPLVFVGRKDRVTKLNDHCGKGGVSWACLGGLVGTPWSDIGGEPIWNKVTVGHADPSTDTTGLLVLGQEATSKLGNKKFDSTALEADDFSAWFQNLEANVDLGGADGPLAQMVQYGANPDVAEVTEAEACTRITGPRAEANLDVVAPTPVTTADVVFAAVRKDGNADAVRDAATGDAALRALAKEHWRVGASPASKTMCSKVGPVALGRTSNLPSPGVLVALASDSSGSR